MPVRYGKPSHDPRTAAWTNGRWRAAAPVVDGIPTGFLCGWVAWL